MVSLRDIRRRIKSVGSIKQIAKSMEMVAVSKLRRAQLVATRSKDYSDKIYEVLKSLSSQDLKHPLFEKRTGQKIGLVVVTGDRGLCGSYNMNVISAANQFLKKYSDVQLILVGRKGIEYFGRRSIPIRYTIPKWGGKITFDEVKQFGDELLSWFLQKELDEIWLVYSKFISVIAREIKVEKFLNIENLEATKTLNYIYEPDAKTVFDEIVPRYCYTKIQHILNEAFASELAARIVSMQSASTNADEMIENLTLTRNKVRQSSITTEMLEIISGAEGLK